VSVGTPTLLSTVVVFHPGAVCAAVGTVASPANRTLIRRITITGVTIAFAFINITSNVY
jgi:hypothetical protein